VTTLSKALSAVLAACALLCACATAYQPDNWTGGFTDTDLGNGHWRVRFAGNGYTTKETVQTYWLYHCAQLTLEKGYDGFRIRTQVDLSAVDLPAYASAGADRGEIVKTRGGGGGHVTYHTVYVGGSAAYVYKPSLQAEVELIKSPFAEESLKVFDAKRMVDALAPHVTGQKCNGNVCPHVHKYLYPNLPDKPS
jgi:hypothetical protein